ncbi:MAG: tetratricopeptide repeat protein [Cryomorphaceae bacterium]|nr:tetratricopeptide repeat protein [Cryomorphaceae bacterium]
MEKLKHKFKTWWPLWALLFITFTVYQQVGSFELINYDDNRYVTDNPDIIDFSFKGIVKMLFAPEYTEELVPPLTSLSLAMNYAVHELNPGGYHKINLLFHLINIVLVVVLIMRVSGNNKWASLFVAAVFAFHPSTTEAVAWVAARKEVQYSMFYLLAALMALKYWETKKTKHYIAVLILFILSYFSKYAAAAFPVFYVAMAILWQKRKDFKKVILESIPFFLFPLYSVYLSLGGRAFFNPYTPDASRDALESISSETLYASFTFFQKLVLGGYSLLHYVKSFLFPFHQQIIYPYPQLDAEGSLPPNFLLYLLGWSILLLAGFYWWKKREIQSSLVGFGIIFFFVHIALVLHVLPIGGRVVVAERYSYLPYIGLAAVGFSFLNRLPKNTSIIVGIGYLVVLLGFTSIRLPQWSNSETIFSDLVDKEPEYATGFISLGSYYYNVGNDREAEPLFLRAIEINPKAELAYLNLGAIYVRSDQLDKAHKYLSKGLEIAPNSAGIHYNMALVYIKRNILGKALSHFEAVTEHGGYGNFHGMAHYHAGRINFVQGNFKIAKEHFTKSLWTQPDFEHAHNNLGMTNAALGEHKEALPHFQRALQLNPGFWMARYQLCVSQFALQNWDAVENLSNQLIQQQPKEPAPYYYLGRALHAKGNVDKGCEAIRNAARGGFEEAQQKMPALCP